MATLKIDERRTTHNLSSCRRMGVYRAIARPAVDQSKRWRIYSLPFFCISKFIGYAWRWGTTIAVRLPCRESAIIGQAILPLFSLLISLMPYRLAL
ncbi:hypothetical protein ABRZ24_06160 [Brenneria populi]|uniref:Uncharacterized protein n=1 Tax=Brenneria populi TaxID=1505588 RepID=A0ABU6JNM4_9GAMM|nr:hypothetical protein [Brenneria populi Li et al. 2015]